MYICFLFFLRNGRSYLHKKLIPGKTAKYLTNRRIYHTNVLDLLSLSITGTKQIYIDNFPCKIYDVLNLTRFISRKESKGL